MHLPKVIRQTTEVASVHKTALPHFLSPYLTWPLWTTKTGTFANDFKCGIFHVCAIVQYSSIEAPGASKEPICFFLGHLKMAVNSFRYLGFLGCNPRPHHPCLAQLQHGACLEPVWNHFGWCQVRHWLQTSPETSLVKKGRVSTIRAL